MCIYLSIYIYIYYVNHPKHQHLIAEISAVPCRAVFWSPRYYMKPHNSGEVTPEVRGAATCCDGLRNG